MIYKRIMDYKGVFSFTVVIGNNVFFTNIAKSVADELCSRYTAILNRANRDIMDLDYQDYVISLQVTTVHHELIIIQGNIKKDAKNRLTIIVHQWTTASVLPEYCKPLLKRQLILDEEKVSFYKTELPFKEKLWEGETEPHVAGLSEKINPVEDKVRPVAKTGVGESPKIADEDILKFLSFIRRGQDPKIEDIRGEDTWVQRVTALPTWPPDLEPGTTLTGEGRDQEDWLPEMTADQTDALSVNSGLKETLREKLKKKKIGGSVSVLEFIRRYRRDKEKNRRKEKLRMKKVKY